MNFVCQTALKIGDEVSSRHTLLRNHSHTNGGYPMGADGEIMPFKKDRCSAVLATAEKSKKERTEKDSLNLAFMLPIREILFLQMNSGRLGPIELTVYSQNNPQLGNSQCSCFESDHYFAPGQCSIILRIVNRFTLNTYFGNSTSSVLYPRKAIIHDLMKCTGKIQHAEISPKLFF